MTFHDRVPASNFAVIAKGTCLEDLLPKRPDLIIMQHLPMDGYPGSSVDLLLNRLQLRFELPALPPIVFLTMHRCGD